MSEEVRDVKGWREWLCYLLLLLLKHPSQYKIAGCTF
jgi:hypothetical protein